MAALSVQPLQELLGRGIEASAEAGRLCAQLEGKRLRLELQGLPLILQIEAHAGGVLVEIDPEGPADCTLSGLPLSMARLGLTGDMDVFREGSVRVSGDPVLAQDFQRLLRLAWPDWEEELALVIGDVVAHRLGSAAQAMARWGRHAGTTLRQDIAEFRTEESRDLPSRHEVDEFLDAVDDLRSDVERAEVRLARLEARIRRGPAG
jgi:ubiquinone biosynthesis protein UbiJ